MQTSIKVFLQTDMKKLRQINFLFVVLALLLVNCNRPKKLQEIDYDQLYAVWYSDDYRDSLAETLKPSIKKALSLKNTPDNRVFIDSVLNQLRWTRDSTSFYKLSQRAIKFAERKSDDYALANIYNDLGVYHHDLGVLDSTYYYYIKAGNVYKKLGDSLKVAELEFYQARVLYEKGLHLESEIKLAELLRILSNYPESPIAFEANFMMGLGLAARDDAEGGEKYLLKALNLMKRDLNKNKILPQEKLTDAILMVSLNLFEVAYYSRDYAKAKQYALESSKYVNQNTPYLLVIVSERNLSICDLLNDLQAKKKENITPYLDGVFSVYDEASRLNNYLAANAQAIFLIDIYHQVGDFDNALKWAEQSYKLAKERDIKVDQQEALEFILKHKNYEYQDRVQEIIALHDDIEQENYVTRNRFARIAYETERVVTENDELRNLILMVIITSLVIILGLSVSVFIFRLRNKNRELHFVKGQQEANESIYQLILEKSTIATEVKQSVRNRIAKDLHDGVVNGIFTIRFNLQQLETANESLKNTLITELQYLEKGTRDISHSLIDNELFSETKFISLIEDLASLQKNKWNTVFSVEYIASEALEELSAIDKVNTYFIIREAVHNINKYSEALHCRISFIGDTDGVTIRIKDNGVGFDINMPGGGIGIQNMKERALALGSELHVFSKVKIGTEVIFKVKQINSRLCNRDISEK